MPAILNPPFYVFSLSAAAIAAANMADYIIVEYVGGIKDYGVLILIAKHSSDVLAYHLVNLCTPYVYFLLHVFRRSAIDIAVIGISRLPGLRHVRLILVILFFFTHNYRLYVLTVLSQPFGFFIHCKNTNHMVYCQYFNADVKRNISIITRKKAPARAVQACLLTAERSLYYLYVGIH